MRMSSLRTSLFSSSASHEAVSLSIPWMGSAVSLKAFVSPTVAMFLCMQFTLSHLRPSNSSIHLLSSLLEAERENRDIASWTGDLKEFAAAKATRCPAWPCAATSPHCAFDRRAKELKEPIFGFPSLSSHSIHLRLYGLQFSSKFRALRLFCCLDGSTEFGSLPWVMIATTLQWIVPKRTVPG